jgi:hypothetical protein
VPIADFRWSDLTDATFDGVRAAHGDNLTSFEGALLVRTDFRGVEAEAIGQWSVAGAIVDAALWPSGYDPTEAGALVAGETDDDAFKAQLTRHFELRDQRVACPDHEEWGSAL